MRSVIFFVIALAMGAASHVFGAELPVTYLVEAREFKRNVSAGDVLTFELYSDPKCQTRVHSDTDPSRIVGHRRHIRLGPHPRG